MTEWWESLSTLVQVLYCIAVPSTLLLLLHTILSISGFGGDSDVNLSDTSGIDIGDMSGADFGGAGDISDMIDLSDLSADVSDGSEMNVHGSYSSLQLFTVQGIVAFLAVSGWVSIASLSSGLPSAGAIQIGRAHV